MFHPDDQNKRVSCFDDVTAEQSHRFSWMLAPRIESVNESEGRVTVYNAVHDCVIKWKACQWTQSAFYNAAGLNASSPKSEQQGETQDPNAFMDLFKEAILKETTMSSISYCKAVMGCGQIAVNGKGQDEGRG